ncbi:MAG: hypothetical protein J6X02_03065 [Bacilli bacterium]|nr:hypothetical protein [Bacilli bacterium]
MTERNEQGFVRDISLAIASINQSNQSSKEKVRALINLPFDFNDVPLINNYINGETTQAVECIDELNNIAILNEQILEFNETLNETLKSKFEERHKELVEALMNRLEGVFKMYNNEDLNQSVQQTYPEVEQPVDVQTPQVEEFSPMTPVESYAAPDQTVEAYGPESFAEPAAQEQTFDPSMDMSSMAGQDLVQPMGMDLTAEPALDGQTVDMSTEQTFNGLGEVAQISEPAQAEETTEVAAPMGMDLTAEPALDGQAVDMATEPTFSGLNDVVAIPEPALAEETTEVAAPMGMDLTVEPTINGEPVNLGVDPTFNGLNDVVSISEPVQAEETAEPELNSELFNKEAESLRGIISPVDDVLPESADLNGEVEEPTSSEEKVEEYSEEEMNKKVKEIEERYDRLKNLELSVLNNENRLVALHREVSSVEDEISNARKEIDEINSLSKVA